MSSDDKQSKTPAPPGSDSSKQAGVSLTQDALRRLRKNRVAMLSLVTLIGIALLAFLTPLLPLAAPDAMNTDKDFAAPFYMPSPDDDRASDDEEGADADKVEDQDRDRLFMDTFKFSPERDEQCQAEAAALEGKIKEAKKAWQEALAKGSDGATKARDQYRNLVNEQRGLVQKAFSEADYPTLGPLTRWMVRSRHAAFGDFEIGPILGRDKLGRDLLSRVFWGARVSLIVGIVATLVSLVIGVTYGMVSGYAGGSIDNAMMRLVDMLYSIPFIFVVIFIITIISADEWKPTLEYYGINKIFIFYVVVGAIYWLTMSRVVRGQVLSLKNEPFVEAARALGVSHAAIIFRHILPNLLSIVIVYLTLTIPRVILFEAFLSFLGLGVAPPDVSWGLLANEGLKVITPVKVYWWLVLFPSLAIGVTLFALNFLGDGLRDAFDPRLKDR